MNCLSKSSVRRKIISSLLMIFISLSLFGQGFNHAWLIGYDIWPKGRMLFDNSSYTFNTETRKMQFWGTEGTISDAYGNFLMSSNGVWIANANNDTMMNGSGLNPGPHVNAWPDGLLITYGNVILPFPGDSTKYVLFHQTGSPSNNVPSLELFYSVIDMTLDSGLGGVISKNNIAFQDTIGWGIGACKHANGRDWWIVAVKDSTDIIYKVLFTPSGVFSITTQQLNVPVAWGNSCQLTFSPDGNKFVYSTYPPGNAFISSLLLFDFDRCSGLFSNPHIINTTDGHTQWGLTFSPNSNFVYKTSVHKVFQIDVNTLSVDTVAFNDTFHSPVPNGFVTDFFLMYPAANGKIYITSGNSVQHIHFINYPDSAGMACDVQQHAINLGIWSFRAVPNHPNYYLGPVAGSICDSLGLSVQEINHDFHFNIFPNPVTEGYLQIIYLLPQNKNGAFEMFDINGRKVYSQSLPQWSTLQQISLPKLSNGLYNCVITSGNERAFRKVAVINE